MARLATVEACKNIRTIFGYMAWAQAFVAQTIVGRAGIDPHVAILIARVCAIRRLWWKQSDKRAMIDSCLEAVRAGVRVREAAVEPAAPTCAPCRAPKFSFKVAIIHTLLSYRAGE